MVISIFDNLRCGGGMVEVLGGLRSKKYEVYLDDNSMGILRLEGVPANLGWFEDLPFRLELVANRQPKKLLAACTIRANLDGKEVGQLHAEWGRLSGEITTCQGHRFSLLTAAKGPQETTVTLEPGFKLLAISGGGSVGMRPIRDSPNQLDQSEIQGKLAMPRLDKINCQAGGSQVYESPGSKLKNASPTVHVFPSRSIERSGILSLTTS